MFYHVSVLWYKHLGCWENTRKSWKSLAYWLVIFNFFSCSPNIPRVYIREQRHGKHVLLLNDHYLSRVWSGVSFWKSHSFISIICCDILLIIQHPMQNPDDPESTKRFQELGHAYKRITSGTLTQSLVFFHIHIFFIIIIIVLTIFIYLKKIKKNI